MPEVLPPVSGEDGLSPLEMAVSIATAIKNKFAPLERFRRPLKNRIILVDLTVDAVEVQLTQLLLSKYLGWELNAVPWGLAFDPHRLSRESQMFCEGFGCTQFVSLGGMVGQVMAENPALPETARQLVQGWPQEGAELRERVMALEFEGLPVGDLIYDTHLRQTGRPSIEKLDEVLISHIIDAFRIYKASDVILKSGAVQALCTLHMAYYHLGILSRLALAYGIPVIQSLSCNPYRIRRFHSFLNARDAVGLFEAREFDHVFNHERETAVATGRRYLDRRLAGLAELGFQDGVEGPYGSTRRRYEKEELCRVLNWDASKPVVVLMSHVFHESPHAVGGNLYNDYYEWLSETLEVAARTPNVQWLLKTHPQQKYFDEMLRHSPLLISRHEVMERLMAPYRNVSHIALSPDDLHTAGLVAVSHAIVTQHGRAGYEFAACGVPVVTSARAAYGGLGFTIEPPSREAYREQLSRIGDLVPLGEDLRERALTYMYLFFEKSRVRSTLLPKIENRGSWAPPLESGFFRQVLDCIHSYQPLEDPLYRRICSMVRNGYTGLLDLTGHD